MKVSWDKVKVGDVVECTWLRGPATVYHVDGRGVFVYSKQAADNGHGHGGVSSGIKSPLGGQRGHWNLWKGEYPEVDVISLVKRFKGNS